MVTAVPVPVPSAFNTLLPPDAAVYHPASVYPVLVAPIVAAVEPVAVVYSSAVAYFGYTVPCVAVPPLPFSVNAGYSTVTVIVADFVLPELLSVATTVNGYCPTALLAATVIVVPLIENPDTAGLIAYV